MGLEGLPGGSLAATRASVCVDVLVSCTYVASCTSGWSQAHVCSDMCVHAHLHMSACQCIKKDHACGCEIREWKRGPLWRAL